jgi:hypothetical protein
MDKTLDLITLDHPRRVAVIRRCGSQSAHLRLSSATYFWDESRRTSGSVGNGVRQIAELP